MINTFKNSNCFAENYLNDVINVKNNGLFEKSEIKWFTVNELKRDMKMFRPHYIPILNTIIYHEQIIKNSVINYNRIKNINKNNYKNNSYNKVDVN